MGIGAFLSKAVACVKTQESGVGEWNTSARSVPDPDAPVLTHLGNGLLVAYLVDEGDHLAYVQGRHLASLGGEPKALHELGLINLAAKAQAGLKMVGDGEVRGLVLDGMFEASLLLLDDLWDGPLSQFTPNGPVIAIPSRDVLAFCDARSTRGVQELHQLCERVMAGNDHVLTATLYQRVAGDWQPLP